MAAIPDFTDRDQWTDDDLDALRAAIVVEQERRSILATAPQQADALARQWAGAHGAADGTDWSPDIARVGYPTGAIAAHNGQTYRSTHPTPNAWEPGSVGAPWVVVWPDGQGGWTDSPPGGTTAEWTPGMHAVVGQQVTYDGHLWECLVEHDTHDGWRPSQFTPTVWRDLGPT